MADLAKTYRDNLQWMDLPLTWDNQEDNFPHILDKIPREQTLTDPNGSALNQTLTEGQTEEALHLSKSWSATRMDECPYELWKALQTQFETAHWANKSDLASLKL